MTDMITADASDADQDLINLFGKGLHQFGLRVHRVQPHEWALPTPCEDWSVRDLVTHLVDEHRWVPPLLAGQSLEQARAQVEGTQDLLSGGEHLGHDPLHAWDETSGASRLAVAAFGDLDRRVMLSRGPTPARTYVTELTMDLAVHAWDLGNAIGYDEELPDDLVAFVTRWVEQSGDLTASGLFAPPVPVPADATPTDRLVAATGRLP